MKPHSGININNIVSEGLEGLPGLLIAIGFVFIFLGIFIPRDYGDPEIRIKAMIIGGLWFAAFVIAEASAAVLFIRASRRNRREIEELKKELHKINE